MKQLLAEIERVTPEGGDWCSVEKASTLAAMIIVNRPRLVVELGVWMGGSAIPIALALRHNSLKHGLPGRLVAIDAWSAEASVAGQEGANLEWWRSIDHARALIVFRERIARHGLTEVVEVVRSPSDAATVPSEIGLLHVDGNHGEQAIRDVERFAPNVHIGGLMVLDDLAWSGGGVTRAWDRAHELGFIDLYPLGTGIAMLRISGTRSS